MGWYLIYGGVLTYFLVAAYEYGWPPVGLFEGWLHTEKSRRIAIVIGWALTVILLISFGLRAVNIARDLWRGI